MIRVGVVSLGAPYHASLFANNMNVQLKHHIFKFLMPNPKYGWAGINFEEIDVLWFYGFHGLPDMLIANIKEENPKIKVVVTWVGSDVLEFVAVVRHRPQCRACIIKNVDVHVADGLNLKQELESLDIKSTYIPSIPEKCWKFKPLPEKFSVAAYVPGFRAEFFNYSMIKEAAAELPDVEFHLFGGGPVKLEPDGYPDYLSNMTYHGWVQGEERDKWWENSSIILYMPKHGSLGVTAIEFLQMGRWAICTREYPHVFDCLSAEELVGVLTNLKDYKEANLEGSKYYQSEYSAEKQAEKVEQILDKI